MGRIYSNAYFTTGATSATATSEGFLSARMHDKVALGFRLNRDSEVRGTVYYRESSEISQDYLEQAQGSPFLQRA
jgi:hypothetical protein